MDRKLGIDEIKTVLINPVSGGEMKFIVVELGDKSNERLVFRADGHRRFHWEIFDDLRCDIEESIKIKCLGGGLMDIDFDGKTIDLCGKSTVYGTEPDRQQTVTILQLEFPHFKIEVA
jgi:hypothetical protein